MESFVQKPVQRSAFRKFAGKEFFILKRKYHWLIHGEQFASDMEADLNDTLINHRSFLLRPLKDVDMHLQHNKVTNLALAIKHINGVVIRPGETFSIWKLVGRPTSAKGYLAGLALDNGKISTCIGGGLCQLGNLLYWMLLHTPLTVTERWRHSYDVFPDVNRKIPFGCGATLSYNYVDLQAKNNTKDTFQVKLWLDDEYLNGEIRCSTSPQFKYEVFEKDHCFKQQWWGGYTRHNRIFRRKLDEKEQVLTEELVTENHAVMMYNPLLPA